ncbi:MAG TPA: pilus assembly protein PilX [Geobacteraceae bacterium]|nr:pilus assembly protein PilX [Geobacteraceae bacterium]
MNHLRNERGIALVTALLLTLITLVIVMALMYYIEMGTKMSGAAKRYKDVRQAGYGGVSLTVNELMPRLENAVLGDSVSVINALKGDYASANLTIPDANCLKLKLSSSTALWGSCSSTLDPKTAPDMTFTLNSTLAGFSTPTQGYIVYTKIVDTSVVGNTDPSENNYLRKPENVNESSAVQGSGVTIPTIYRIEIQAEREQNPMERTKLSVVYAY